MVILNLKVLASQERKIQHHHYYQEDFNMETQQDCLYEENDFPLPLAYLNKQPNTLATSPKLDHDSLRISQQSAFGYLSNFDQKNQPLNKKKSISSTSGGGGGQASNRTTSTHKKSHSLYNKKIVEIIQGLQQSLGVIASNVKSSYSDPKQEKALLESALLAQKLAQMTSNMGKASDKEDNKTKKRKTSKGANSGFRTIEEANEALNRIQSSNRQSIDVNQSNAGAGCRGNSAKNYQHQRNRSDQQPARKQQCNSSLMPQKPIHGKTNTLLVCSSIENAHNSQFGQFIEDQPNTTKNRSSLASQRQSSKQSKQLALSSGQTSILHTGQISTVENQRNSISALGCQKSHPERLSEANYLLSKLHKYPIQNQADSRLKSAASSPSLHSSTTHNSSSIPLKPRKQAKQIQQNLVFDFTKSSDQNQNTALTAQQSKGLLAKKKNLMSIKAVSQSSANTSKGINSSSHKRATSDGSSLTKMFHFKQQMLINKIFNQHGAKTAGQASKQMSTQQTTINSQKLTNANQSKVQVVSSLSSKRLSNEDENQENHANNYNSPRFFLQKPSSTKPQQAQPIQQSQVYSEMKNFLLKFKDKTNLINNQQLPTQLQQPQVQKQMLIQALQQQNTRSTNLTQETLSNGSQISKKKANPQKIVKGSQCIENIAPMEKRQSQQITNSKYTTKPINTTQHKRAKSDVNQLMQKFSQPKPLFNAPNQRMFFLNLNHHHQPSQPQPYPITNTSDKIYSARASPTTTTTHTLSTYLLDDRQQPTARSDRPLSNKQQPFSNQTTQKKTNAMVLQSMDTPQFNYNLVETSGSMPRTKLQYDRTTNEDYTHEKVINSQQIAKNLLSNILYGSSDTQQQNKIYTLDELYQSERHLQAINQSPRLKLLPTPKAVQPGNLPTFESIGSKQSLFVKSMAKNNYQQPKLTYENIQEPNKKVMYETQQQQPQQQEYLETQESNVDENLSPRSKEKRRIIKLIKVSFNKLKEPIKTTAEFYRIGKMLGKGAFGRVNLAIHKLTEQLVAVKSINKQFLTEDESSKKKVMQEVLILQKTRHPGIVKLFDSFETNKHIVFVMELCSGGDLLNYVRKRRKLKEPIAKYVFRQVVEALGYCHAKGIVHRDIKLDNLLLDDQANVKICDFGVSRHLQDKNEIMTEQCGTPAYIAPEILKDKGYKGFGVDVWSLGVCLYAMLYGTVPFKANNMNELHQLIMKAKYSLKDEKVELSEDAKGLIRALLEPDPSKRLSISQVKQHPWLQEAYDPSFTVEIFTPQELETIRKDFTYQDMRRYKRNATKPVQDAALPQDDQQPLNQQQQQQHLTTEHLFTEHELDSTTNALMKNCSTKSVILAPFNSTRSHIEVLPLSQNESQEEEDNRPLEFDRELLVDKRCIKYAARVKDINRQYEMNNNCELDNGVYNKFVKQSTEGDENKEDEGLLSQENSLVKSFNKQQQERMVPQAPLVSQNSDDEAEAELLMKNQQQNSHSELQQLHTFLQLQSNKFTSQVQDEQILLDYEIVERVEGFGYPRAFIIDSIENNEMNDAGTCYYLLDKDKQLLDMFC